MQTHPQQSYSACTSILVGKLATADGSTMIGRNEDSRAAWAKAFVVHPHAEFQDPQMFVSAEKDHDFSMPLPAVRGKYTATPEWTTEFGVFEEDGINEYGVAMSATESAYSNERVLAADPLVKDGISEEAMVTVVLPYIHSARAGVKRLGQLIEKYGTSESNGILFSDANEVWYLETAGGHQWVAQRIPDDSYAVVANQLAIQEIDFNDPENFLTVPGLQKFVADHHLGDQKTGFNFRQIFGTHDLTDQYYNTPRVWDGQRLLNPEIDQDPQDLNLPFIRKASHLIHPSDVQQVLAAHFNGTQYDPLGTGSEADRHKFRPISLAKTQEAHILQIRPNLPIAQGGIHWLAMGVAAQSVFVPFYAGIDDTPVAYQTATKAYDPHSAYWVFKHASVLLDPHYRELGADFKAAQQALRINLAQQLMASDQQVAGLTGQSLTTALTKASFTAADTALKAYRQLTSDLITKSTDLSPLNYQTDLNL